MPAVRLTQRGGCVNNRAYLRTITAQVRSWPAYMRVHTRLAAPPNEDDDLYQRVRARVLWWINDMCFKAPEQLGERYYEAMADDVARLATGREEEEA